MLLLDTNVVSELRKVRNGRASSSFIAWEATVRSTELMISVITIQELETGVLRLERSNPRQAQVLRDWLMDYVIVEFRNRTLPITTEIARRSALLLIDDGSYTDALIAATAYVHGLTVATRNVKHFANTGVRVINPWET